MSILALTSDTLASPAAAGSIEYASPIFAATPIGTQRGIIPTQQYYRLDSSLAGANATGAQNLLGVGCTLSSSTVYEFEILAVVVKTAGTTSHSFQLSFGGTATINNILYAEYSIYGTGGLPGALNQAQGIVTNSTTAQTQVTTATAAIFMSFLFKGTVSINAGGTFIPQYTLSSAPGGAYTTQAGSFIRIAPIGASGAATNVGTWA